MNTPYREDAMPDPAETETAQRRKVQFASTFDRMVEANLAQVEASVAQATSNVELGKTVRTAVVVVAGCAVVSMLACTFMVLSMHVAMGEMRAMLQTILDALPKAHA